ncbi:hypothetical protein [Pengzhenrongella frigida]|uniref:Uncharacterized protein n=1 Tax=Pengzhenrongella frigida TaxID=1259133 RepID=A0A4Q5N1V6_9MICO|nr:hypothetical protein [Cellulomonas sp. HLT2-17]RYV52090.1 hypothetical protein EUA98_04800 [Cellulomonas sp. HLT2-17]
MEVPGPAVVPEGVGWEPESLGATAAGPRDLDPGWRYVLVEEIVGETAVLVSWPWPSADLHGRLFWPADLDEAGLEAAVPVALLRSQLYSANGLLRAPRCGDTFAARVDGALDWGTEQPVADLRRLFPGAVFDISADAHAAVRLTHKASTAPVQHGPPGGEAGSPGAGAGATASASVRRSAEPAPLLELGPPSPFESEG